MTTITVGSDEYKALLHRFNELWDTKNLSKSERAEMREIGAQLDAAELRHATRQAGAIE